jgi:hypothetical protein
MATVNMAKLNNQAKELRELYGEVNRYLSNPEVRKALRLARLQMLAVTAPHVALGYAVYLGLTWNDDGKKSPDPSLESQYNELIVKYDLLSQRHETVTKELEVALRNKEKRLGESEKTIAELRAEIARLKTMMDRITAMQAKVA